MRFDNRATDYPASGLHLGFEAGGRKILYCYIRKNACSSFKRLIVKGSPQREDLDQAPSRIQFMRRHHGVRKIRPQDFDHSIFVFRDPVDRLISVFRNKFIQRDGNKSVFENYSRLTGREPGTASFETFMRDYIRHSPDALDIHMRPQHHDLAPVCYSDPILLEDLHSAMRRILGSQLADRYFLKRTNSTSQIPAAEIDTAWERTADELHDLWTRTGAMPDGSALLTPEFRDQIRDLYREDYRILETIRAIPRPAGRPKSGPKPTSKPGPTPVPAPAAAAAPLLPAVPASAPGAAAGTAARPKIFLIGFNKCGTSSFHFLFNKSGLASVHFGGADQDSNIALKLHRNVMLGRPLLSGMETFDAYSDISYCDDAVHIEGSRFFRDLHAEYPDAFFILNTRDRDNWLRSRISQGSGSFLRRSASAYRCSETEIIELWKEQFATHGAEVRDFFAARPESRFLEFDIEEGRIDRVVRFLQPDYEILPRWWQKKKETPDNWKQRMSGLIRKV